MSSFEMYPNGPLLNGVGPNYYIRDNVVGLFKGNSFKGVLKKGCDSHVIKLCRTVL